MSKYRAVRTTVDGYTFDSKREAARYGQLRLLERAGEITDLELQPVFPLLVNGIVIGKYIADFRYRTKHRTLVIEDAKGVRTPVYRLKKKLVEALHDVRIVET